MYSNSTTALALALVLTSLIASLQRRPVFEENFLYSLCVPCPCGRRTTSLNNQIQPSEHLHDFSLAVGLSHTHCAERRAAAVLIM